jgi:hypothetical protein
VVQGREGGGIGTDPFFEPGRNTKVRCRLPTYEGKKEMFDGVNGAEVVDIGVMKCESGEAEAE